MTISSITSCYSLWEPSYFGYLIHVDYFSLVSLIKIRGRDVDVLYLYIFGWVMEWIIIRAGLIFLILFVIKSIFYWLLFPLLIRGLRHCRFNHITPYNHLQSKSSLFTKKNKLKKAQKHNTNAIIHANQPIPFPSAYNLTQKTHLA